MRQSAMLRFLELLQAELGAEDTRAELGGKDPSDPRTLFTLIPGGFRIVAIFDAPPEPRAQKQHKLEELARGFGQTLSQASLPSPPPAPDATQKRLDAALESLRSRTGAVEIVIVDRQSPVLWGASDPRRHEEDVSELTQIGDALHTLLQSEIDLDAICALQPADLDSRLRDLAVEREPAELLARAVQEHGDETELRHFLLTSLSIARARAEAEGTHAVRFTHHAVKYGYLVRAFANIYLLVFVFEGAFSELYVESAAIHALPAVEQLVLALPPRDPPPAAGRGRVIRLRRR